MPSRELHLTIYDFDDTIYRGDSSVKFWWFLLTKRPLFFLLSPWFLLLIILHGLGIIDRNSFKQAMYLPINDVPLNQIQSWVGQYWARERNNINAWFPQRLSEEKKQGLIPVCISASPRFLIEDMIRDLDIPHLICTEMQSHEGRISHRMQGKNCRGQEKVRRLNAWAQEQGMSYIVEKFASDSKADLPLYKLAREKYFVKDGIITKGSP